MKELIILICVITCFLITFIIGNYLYKEHQEQIRIALEKELVEKIKSHYGDVVTITKDTNLYDYVDGKYNVVGTISKEEVVSLEAADINKETKYFKIKELGYFVRYQDLKVGGQLLVKSDRHKKYLLFNENVVT